MTPTSPNSGAQPIEKPNVWVRVFAFLHWCGVWELAGFVLLAISATWPLATQMSSTLPQGREPCATVPLLNAWTIWWNAEAASRGFSDYWEAPILHPSQHAFALSEAQPTSLIAAPVVYAAGEPTLAYNVYLLAALALNGWSVFHLLRYLQLTRPGCIAGGAMAVMLPYVHWQLGVLQLVPLFGMVWTIHGLLRFRERPTWLGGTAAGAAFGLTYWLCNYYGLFFGMALASGVWWLAGRTWLPVLLSVAAGGAILYANRHADAFTLLVIGGVFVANFAAFVWVVPLYKKSIALVCVLAAPVVIAAVLCAWVAGVILTICWCAATIWLALETRKHVGIWVKLSPCLMAIAVMTIPIVYVQYAAAEAYKFTRPFSTVNRLAGALGDYTTTPFPQLIPSWDMRDENHRGSPLSPGWLKIGLAAIGVGFGLSSKRRRMVTLFCVATIVFAVGMSTAPRIAFDPAPWMDSISAIDSMRYTENDETRIYPYRWLMQNMPGLSSCRSLHRFAVIAQLMSVVLAGIAISGGWSMGARLVGKGRTNSRLNRSTGVFLCCVCVGVAIAAVWETWPIEQGFYTAPALQQHKGWTTYIRRHAAKNEPIVCLPFPAGKSAEHYEGTTVWMFLQAGHERPILNGYSGYFPKSMLMLKEPLKSFPNKRSINLLRERGVRYCVVKRSFVARDSIEGDPFLGDEIQHVYGDDTAQIDIYDIGN